MQRVGFLGSPVLIVHGVEVGLVDIAHRNVYSLGDDSGPGRHYAPGIQKQAYLFVVAVSLAGSDDDDLFGKAFCFF